MSNSILASITYTTTRTINTILTSIMTSYTSSRHSIIIKTFITQTTRSCSSICPTLCTVSSRSLTFLTFIVATSTYVIIVIVVFVKTRTRSRRKATMSCWAIASQTSWASSSWTCSARIMTRTASWYSIIIILNNTRTSTRSTHKYPIISRWAWGTSSDCIVACHAWIMAW